MRKHIYACPQDIQEARLLSDSVSITDTWETTATSRAELWRKGPNSISIAAGNIFDYFLYGFTSERLLIAIPVDTSFSTKLATNIEGGNPFFVSEKTLHGKFLERLYTHEAPEKIMSRIEAELSNSGAIRNGNGQWPIGSIAVIEDSRISYCLLAISEHDSFGNTQSCESNIRAAIESLILFYDRKGQGYPLLIPLIGTGRSRSGLSHQESFELILDCLLDNKHRIQGNITIVALPEAYEEINWQQRKEHCGA